MQVDRLSRAFEVLVLLSSHKELRAADISVRLNLPLSSTHNLLRTMVGANLLVERPERHYMLGPRAVRIALRVVSSVEIRTIVRPYLEMLARTIQGDLYLAMRSGDRVIYVDRCYGGQPVSVDIRLGQRLYLHSISAGKLFAAFKPDLREFALAGPKSKLTKHTITERDQLEAELDRVVEVGHAVSREESIEGVYGIAVPIFDLEDSLQAGIHVSTLSAGMSEQRHMSIVDEVIAVARTVEAETGVTHK